MARSPPRFRQISDAPGSVLAPIVCGTWGLPIPFMETMASGTRSVLLNSYELDGIKPYQIHIDLILSSGFCIQFFPEGGDVRHLGFGCVEIGAAGGDRTTA